MVSNMFVVLMGMGTVFFGLICIVFLILLTGRIVKKLEKKSTPGIAAPASASAETVRKSENDAALIAVVSSVLAEELGTDVNNVIVTSIQKA